MPNVRTNVGEVEAPRRGGGNPHGTANPVTAGTVSEAGAYFTGALPPVPAFVSGGRPMTVANQNITNAIGVQELIDIANHASIDVEWASALRVADGLVPRMLLVSGVLNEGDDVLYASITKVANEFGFDDTQKRFTDELESRVKSLEDRQAIEPAANDMEYAKMRGAYAFGLAVGLRLAGGAR